MFLAKQDICVKVSNAKRGSMFVARKLKYALFFSFSPMCPLLTAISTNVSSMKRHTTPLPTHTT